MNYLVETNSGHSCFQSTGISRRLLGNKAAHVEVASTAPTILADLAVARTNCRKHIGTDLASAAIVMAVEKE